MKEYLRFERDEAEDDELVEAIVNKKTKEDLGWILFDKSWKKYVADFGDVYFDADCLEQIVKHLRELDKRGVEHNE